MFAKENSYARARKKSVAASRELIDLDAQRQWRTDEPSDAEGINLPGRCIYAQNDVYLELCNPGWDFQWRAGIGNLFVVLPALFIIWCWYGFAVHPLIFNKMIVFFCLGDYLISGMI